MGRTAEELHETPQPKGVSTRRAIAMAGVGTAGGVLAGGAIGWGLAWEQISTLFGNSKDGALTDPNKKTAEELQLDKFISSMGPYGFFTPALPAAYLAELPAVTAGIKSHLLGDYAVSSVESNNQARTYEVNRFAGTLSSKTYLNTIIFAQYQVAAPELGHGVIGLVWIDIAKNPKQAGKIEFPSHPRPIAPSNLDMSLRISVANMTPEEVTRWLRASLTLPNTESNLTVIAEHLQRVGLGLKLGVPDTHFANKYKNKVK